MNIEQKAVVCQLAITFIAAGGFALMGVILARKLKVEYSRGRLITILVVSYCAASFMAYKVGFFQ